LPTIVGGSQGDGVFDVVGTGVLARDQVAIILAFVIEGGSYV